MEHTENYDLYKSENELLFNLTTSAETIDNLIKPFLKKVSSNNGGLSANGVDNKTILIIKRIIKHPNTSAETLDYLYSYLYSSWDRDFYFLIQELLERIVDEMNSDSYIDMDSVLERVALYKEITSELLEKIADKCSDIDVLINVAKNRKASYELLEEIVNNTNDSCVLREVVLNENSSIELLEKIIDKTNDAEVLISVALNKKISTETLDKIVDKTNDADVLISVSYNSKTSSKTLDKIVDKIDYINNIDDIYVLLSAKKNKNISEETFERIMKILTKNLIKEVSLALCKIVLVFAVISYFYYNIYTLSAFICTICFYLLSKFPFYKYKNESC